MVAVDRIGAAPISWGVCEVPGWGYQEDYRTVLKEIASLGITDIELGPEGFLPEDSNELKAILDEYGLNLIGGFVPTVLFREDVDPLPNVLAVAKQMDDVGAKVLVLSADSGETNYDEKQELTEEQWQVLYVNLKRIQDALEDSALTVVLHPHVGTMVETAEQVQRVLDNSTIGLCIDTGHLLIGGADPVSVIAQAPERVGHVHLKDVNLELLEDVKDGRKSYTEAVRAGLYTVLGEGGVNIAKMVNLLEESGYQGLYVMEQDLIIDEDEAGDRLGLKNTQASIKFLQDIE